MQPVRRMSGTSAASMPDPAPEDKSVDDDKVKAEKPKKLAEHASKDGHLHVEKRPKGLATHASAGERFKLALFGAKEPKDLCEPLLEAANHRLVVATMPEDEHATMCATFEAGDGTEMRDALNRLTEVVDTGKATALHKKAIGEASKEELLPFMKGNPQLKEEVDKIEADLSAAKVEVKAWKGMEKSVASLSEKLDKTIELIRDRAG